MSERVRLEAKPKRTGHRFQKGDGKPPGSGRRAGTPNRHSRILRECIIAAAEQIGQDKRGKDGLTGYLKFLAVEHPDLFSVMLTRVLPLQLTGENNGPVKVHMSLPELEQYLQERGLPLSFKSPAGTLLQTPDPASVGVATITRH